MNKREQLIETIPDEEFLFADGYDEAILGYDSKTLRIIYSVSKCIEILIKDQGMHIFEKTDMKTICQKHFEENCKICHPEIYDMKKLNELYNKIDSWYKKQDPKSLKKFLQSGGGWNYQRNKFVDFIFWYEEIQEWTPEIRDYFLGTKEISLEIIQNHFREFMRPGDIPTNEKELINLAIGDFDDDMNIYQIEGDLRSSGSLPMMFAFLYYKKDWNKDMYDEKLYNSLQYTEELQDMFKFVDYQMPSDEEIDKIIEKEINSGNKKLEQDFKSKIEEIIREFQYKEGFENRLNALKNLIIE